MKKSKTRILLINPPQTFYPTSMRFSKSFPIGLAYIAAVLDSEGYSVEILDTLITHFEVMERNSIKQYGMSWKNIEKEIKERQPSIVGITCPFTTQIENTVRISDIVKEIDPDIMTIIGGPDASVRASNILKQSKHIDIAIIGEGECTMLEVVTKYDKCNLGRIDQVAGIAYKKGNEVVVNPMRDFIRKLDDLPLPAYHLFDMNAYFDKRDEYLYANRGGKRLRELPFITSRGCPYNCVFCSIHLHMGKKWRAHSASQVLDHISHVTQRYGVNYIHFEDDNFTLSLERTKAILDGIVERGLKFIWDTPNGVRADHLDKNVLAKMKKTGCIELRIGIESGDQLVLDRIVGKQLMLTQVLETARASQEIGIQVYAFFVLGFPGETIANMKKTVAFAEEISEAYDVHPFFLVATPLYGTRLHEICVQKGYLVKELSSRALSEGTQHYGAPLIRTEDFGPEDIKCLVAQYIDRDTVRRQARFT